MNSPQKPSSDGCFAMFSAWNDAAKKNNVFKVSTGTPSPSDIDSLIAQEMNSLSIQDREKALEDLHCVVDTSDEDQDFINNRLDLMDYHLNSIKTDEDAYTLAERMDQPYVTSRRLRLMFLRSELYSPRDAATKMVGFFEEKKRLFGEGKLCKEITLGDLDEDDMNTLRSGWAQVSSARDKAGRQIVCFFQNNKTFRVQRNLERALFYCLTTMVESEAVQKQGIVIVFYFVDVCPDWNYQKISPKLRKLLPVHYGGTHLCLNDPKTFAGCTMGILNASKKERMRYRMHYGSHIECLYHLLTYGIGGSSLPVVSTGVISTKAHLEWLKRRQEIESARASNLMVQDRLPAFSMVQDSQPTTTPESFSALSDQIVVRPEDVLFGRGRHIQEQLGNVRLKELVETYAPKFDAFENYEKIVIASLVAKRLTDTGGRFLKCNSDGVWEEVDEKTALKKINHTFRNRRRL